LFKLVQLWSELVSIHDATLHLASVPVCLELEGLHPALLGSADCLQYRETKGVTLSCTSEYEIKDCHPFI